MFRPDGPIVTIITYHAGSGCQHGVVTPRRRRLESDVYRRFWAAAIPRGFSIVGRLDLSVGDFSANGALLRVVV